MKYPREQYFAAVVAVCLEQMERNEDQGRAVAKNDRKKAGGERDSLKFAHPLEDKLNMEISKIRMCDNGIAELEHRLLIYGAEARSSWRREAMEGRTAESACHASNANCMLEKRLRGKINDSNRGREGRIGKRSRRAASVDREDIGEASISNSTICRRGRELSS